MISFNGNLKDYVCTAPFDSLFITESGVYPCCWTDKSISRSLDIDAALNSNELKNFRQTILDGSFSLCSDRCWYLHNKYGTVYHKDNLDEINNEETRNAIISGDADINIKILSFINNAYDESCNLRCPSCRNSFRNSDNFTSYRIFKQIENKAKDILIGGSGDPFYQKYTLRWMQNMKKEDISNVVSFNIMTNGMLLNENTWATVSDALKEKSLLVQISLDGCTKETVEKLRLGSNWEVLKKNLKFINECGDFAEVHYNFVVQNDNFREMIEFFKFAISMNAIPKFSRIRKWSHLNEMTFKEADIFNENHRNHKEFLDVLKDPIFDKYEYINELY